MDFSSDKISDNLDILNVGDIVARQKHLYFHPDQFVKLILKAMQKNNAGCAAVINDKGQMIGMLTEREILRTIFDVVNDSTVHSTNIGKYLDDMLVSDVMISNPKTIYADTDIEHALETMTRWGFRFMPVFDRMSGETIGLIDERVLAIHVKNRLDRVKREAKEKDILLKGLLGETYGVVNI